MGNLMKISIIFLSALLIFSFVNVFVSSAASSNSLKLPNSNVNIEVVDGSISHFETNVSNVPAGFDVVNGTYLGWCVDQNTSMSRAPAVHLVTLYSSLNAPGEMANENWTMVNYILNHKQGYGATSIQEAIWYFVDFSGIYIPQDQGALALVNDTLAHGSNFVPTKNQTVAVICYPATQSVTDYQVQISIIEVNQSQINPLPTPSPTATPLSTATGSTNSFYLTFLYAFDVIGAAIIAILLIALITLERRRKKKPN